MSFRSKSPLVLLLLLTILVISTLITASAYFLRPSIETEIKEKVIEKIEQKGLGNMIVDVSGRDVTISGYVDTKEKSSKVEEISSEVQGVREINNKLLIKNLPND
ncbi:MAG: BON domain-containing protein [Cocleimonas sp.]